MKCPKECVITLHFLLLFTFLKGFRGESYIAFAFSFRNIYIYIHIYIYIYIYICMYVIDNFTLEPVTVEEFIDCKLLSCPRLSLGSYQI